LGATDLAEIARLQFSAALVGGNREPLMPLRTSSEQVLDCRAMWSYRSPTDSVFWIHGGRRPYCVLTQYAVTKQIEP
jgi:hypothetical protein